MDALMGEDSARLLTEIILAVCAMIGVMVSFHRANLSRLLDLREKMQHQDACLDDLRKAINETILNTTRESRVFFTREALELELNRMRTAISSETNDTRQMIYKVQGDVADTREALSDVRTALAGVTAVQQVNIRRISDLIAEAEAKER